MDFAALPWLECRIALGFVSDSRGVFRTNAGQRSGKPQGMRRQMRRLFIRTAAPGVASGRSTRSTGSDRSGRGGTKERTGCSGRSRRFMAFSVFSFSSSFSVEEIYFFLSLFLFLYIWMCLCCLFQRVCAKIPVFQYVLVAFVTFFSLVFGCFWLFFACFSLVFHQKTLVFH